MEQKNRYLKFFISWNLRSHNFKQTSYLFTSITVLHTYNYITQLYKLLTFLYMHWSAAEAEQLSVSCLPWLTVALCCRYITRCCCCYQQYQRFIQYARTSLPQLLIVKNFYENIYNIPLMTRKETIIFLLSVHQNRSVFLCVCVCSGYQLVLSTLSSSSIIRAD